MIEFFEFQLRPRILFKAGLVDELGSELALLGERRAFLVADQGVARAGLLERVQAGLAGAVEVVGVFTDVPANSSVTAVEQGAALAQAAGADLIIAVGGGSPIDTGKAIRILLTEGGTLRDHQGYNLLTRALTPMVVIPTTSGTGSEVTSWAVIRDDEAGIKLPFSSPFLAPDIAILDPELTRTLPPRLTAATGMDALTHAIESFVGSNSNPVTDSLAVQAIEMIANNLRAATHQGDDMDARSQMLIASCMAGIAFSGGGGSLGIVHAIAHSVGGKFEVHHGTANSIILPHGMRFNASTIPHRLVRVALALGVNAGGRSDEAVIEDGVLAVVQLAADCGLPLRLRDVNVPEEALSEIAEMSMGDPAIFTNPRQASVEEVLDVARAAW